MKQNFNLFKNNELTCTINNNVTSVCVGNIKYDFSQDGDELTIKNPCVDKKAVYLITTDKGIIELTVFRREENDFIPSNEYTTLPSTDISDNNYPYINTGGGVERTIFADKRSLCKVTYEYKVRGLASIQYGFIKNSKGLLTTNLGTVESLGGYNFQDEYFIAQPGRNDLIIKSATGDLEIKDIKLELIKPLKPIIGLKKFTFNTMVEDSQFSIKTFGEDITSVSINGVESIPFNSWNCGSAISELFRHVNLCKDVMNKLPYGLTKLELSTSAGSQTLEIERKNVEESEFEIMVFNVSHSNSSLLKFKDEIILVDNSTEEGFLNGVVPYLNRNKLKIDKLLITHDHEDHDAFKMAFYCKEQRSKLPKNIQEAIRSILKKDYLQFANHKTLLSELGEGYMKPQHDQRRYNFINNSDMFDHYILKEGDIIGINDHIKWNICPSARIHILNSRYNKDGSLQDNLDENFTSVAYILEHNGFRYFHSTDIWSDKHIDINNKLNSGFFDIEGTKVDVFVVLHHCHGNVDTQALLDTDADINITPCDGEVYSRGDYTLKYLNYQKQRPDVEHILHASDGSVKFNVYKKGYDYQVHRPVKGNNNWMYISRNIDIK